MVTVAGGEHLLCEYCSFTIQYETLMNPHFNSFDEIHFDELLDINSKFPVVQYNCYYSNCS